MHVLANYREVKAAVLQCEGPAALRDETADTTLAMHLCCVPERKVLCLDIDTLGLVEKNGSMLFRVDDRFVDYQV